MRHGAGHATAVPGIRDKSKRRHLRQFEQSYPLLKDGWLSRHATVIDERFGRHVHSVAVVWPTEAAPQEGVGVTLFLHGITGHAERWTPRVVRELARRGSCVVMPTYSDTCDSVSGAARDALDAALRVAAQAAQRAGARGGPGCQTHVRLQVVGHSFGASVAQEIAYAFESGAYAGPLPGSGLRVNLEAAVLMCAFSPLRRGAPHSAAERAASLVGVAAEGFARAVHGPRPEGDAPPEDSVAHVVYRALSRWRGRAGARHAGGRLAAKHLAFHRSGGDPDKQALTQLDALSRWMRAEGRPISTALSGAGAAAAASVEHNEDEGERPRARRTRYLLLYARVDQVLLTPKVYARDLRAAIGPGADVRTVLISGDDHNMGKADAELLAFLR